MAEIIQLNTAFEEAIEAPKEENRVKLFTSVSESRIIAANEYIQNLIEKNLAQNFKIAEFDNGEQLRSGLNGGTLLNRLKAADIIRMDEIYDLRDGSETQQVVGALQDALSEGKLVILTGDPVSMEKFIQAHTALKADAALTTIGAETIRKQDTTPHRQRSFTAFRRS